MASSCPKCSAAGFSLCVCHGLPTVPKRTRQSTPKACKPATWTLGRSTRFGRGEANPDAKLTEADVREILSRDEKSPELAREYGVDESLVRMIRGGRRWGHLKAGR